MKRKKRNPKIIEMSLFNIGGKSKEGDKRVDELKRQKGAEAQPTKSSDFPSYNPAHKLAHQVKRAISTSKERSDSKVVNSPNYNPPSYNPAYKLAEQVKRAISTSKERLDSKKENKKVDTANYLSNEELLQRVYFMFGSKAPSFMLC